MHRRRWSLSQSTIQHLNQVAVHRSRNRRAKPHPTGRGKNTQFERIHCLPFSVRTFLGTQFSSYPGTVLLGSNSDRSRDTRMRRAAAGAADPGRVPAAQEHTPGHVPHALGACPSCAKGGGRPPCTGLVPPRIGQVLSSSAFPETDKHVGVLASTVVAAICSVLICFLSKYNAQEPAIRFPLPDGARRG